MATYPDSDIIALVFEKHRTETERTRLFRNAPAERQAFLLERAGLAAVEVPIVSHFEDEAAWCLITSRRLIWPRDGTVEALDLRDLTTVDGELEELFARWNEAPDRASWHPKTVARKLQVSAIDGRMGELQLEPGAPYYAMWSVLLWLCRRANNQRAATDAKGRPS